MINKKQGITIHNTGNNLSAKKNSRKIKYNEWNGYHYLVDDIEIIQLSEDFEIVHHTGKGFDAGNTNTISIAICLSTSNKYIKAEEKAIILIKKLMIKYDLNFNDIYFHCDWNTTTYCPHRILDNFTKKEWIERKLKSGK